MFCLKEKQGRNLNVSFLCLERVAHITQVDGIAYVANNIYFSSWFTLAACVYTLDKWSAAKDILSIEELTGLSATLKSWYCLFLSSLVTMGTSGDLHHSVSDDFKSSAAYGIVLGLISTLVSLFFILVHYRLIDYEFLQVGGWIELSASFFMILLWVVGVAILTAEGGIAATIGGSGCTANSNTEYARDFGVDECFVIWEPTPEDLDSDGSSETERVTERPTAIVEPNSGSPTMAPTDSPTEKKEEGETSAPTIRVTEVPTDGTTTPELPTATPENQATSNPTNGTNLDETETTETDLEGPGNELAPDDQGGIGVDDSIFEGNVDDDGALNTPNNDEGDTAADDVENDFIDVDAGAGLGDMVNATMDDMTNFTTVDDFGNITMDDDLADFDSNLLDEEGNETARSLQGIQLVGVDLEPTDLMNSTTNETENSTTVWTDMPSTSPTPQPSQTSFPTMSPTTMSPTITNKMSCIDVLDRQIPGSNLYLASWICFFAAFNITLRWKAAQAMQFAQAQHRKADEQAALAEDDDIGSEKDNNDGDDDPDGEMSYGAEEDDNL
jgi:hypothetical protein